MILLINTYIASVQTLRRGEDIDARNAVFLNIFIFIY